MKGLVREHGLTIALMAMFLLSALAMIWSGHLAYNEDLREHGDPTVGMLGYLTSGDFISALFENWESEFLQMSAYVMMTAMFFQRGSAESRDPDDPYRPKDETPKSLLARSRILAWLYSYSLSIALALLFLASFVHWWGSMAATNEEALRHGGQIEARKLSARREAVVRVVPKLAVGIHVDGGSRRPLDIPAPQGFTRIQTRGGGKRRGRCVRASTSDP